MRHLMLSTCDAGHNLRNHGMILRVDIFGNLRICSIIGSSYHDSVTKPVVDDSPYAGGLGIATVSI